MSDRKRAQVVWLAHTKFHPPALVDDIVARPALLARLRQAITDHRLTLLSAPAGYGKTTLLAALCQSSPGMLVCWITLDAEDNDFNRFLASIIAALAGLQPGCGSAAASLLSGRAPSARRAHPIVSALINDVMALFDQPVTLILDDLHLVTEPGAYIALNHLLDQLPQHMRVVIATRHDPALSLARLRARGHLAEFRLPDLRFTPGEADAFLQRRLGNRLAEHELSVLYQRTEGWAAGVRLLASSLEQLSDPAARATFINHVSSTDHHVFDFLAEEVLNQQTPSTRAFLLSTSILADLTPEACQIVTGQRNARSMLRRLCQRNLFVTAVDTGTQPETYRYHALFAEFLRRRLEQTSPDHRRELHRRAASALANSPLSIDHWLKAEAYDEAVAAIQRIGLDCLAQGMLDTLLGWIRAVPSCMRSRSADLAYLEGMCSFQTGDLADGRALLERSSHLAAATGDQPALGKALAGLVSCAFVQGDFASASDTIDRAVGLPLSPYNQVQLSMSRAWIKAYQRDWPAVTANLQAAFDIVDSSPANDAVLALALYLAPDFATLPGILSRMERFCQINTAQPTDRITPLQVAIEELNCFTHLWRGRPGDALAAGRRAVDMKRRLGGYPFVGTAAAVFGGLAALAQNDTTSALDMFKRLFDIPDPTDLDRSGLPAALYLLARACWAQGRREEAIRLSAEMDALAASQAILSPETPVLQLVLRALNLMADRRYPPAERAVCQAVDLQASIPTSRVYTNPRLILARLYLDSNRRQAALSETIAVLSQCAQERTPGPVLIESALVRPLLELAAAHTHSPCAAYASHLLTLLVDPDERRPARVPHTGETLSAREVEVLRLIADGLSNHGIAHRLFITEQTVKSHVSHIFGKLDVASRTQAAVVAVEMGISRKSTSDS